MVYCAGRWSVLGGSGQLWRVVQDSGQYLVVVVSYGVLCRTVVSTWWPLMSPMNMSCQCGTGRRLTVVSASRKSRSVLTSSMCLGMYWFLHRAGKFGAI